MEKFQKSNTYMFAIRQRCRYFGEIVLLFGRPDVKSILKRSYHVTKSQKTPFLFKKLCFTFKGEKVLVEVARI